MLSPPEDLATGTLALALADGWGLRVDTAQYRPVGFGSHHWAVTDAEGTRWFATVDELETKRHRADEPLDPAFGRLRASPARRPAVATRLAARREPRQPVTSRRSRTRSNLPLPDRGSSEHTTTRCGTM